MSNALKKIEQLPCETIVATQITVTDEQLNLFRKTYAPGLTDAELQLFGQVCNHCKLDPVLRQIHAIKRGRNDKQKMCIQTSIDGFRLIAERTRRYAPGDDTQFSYNKDGELTAAKVFVKKQTSDGTWHQISATALLEEYHAGYGQWNSMPHVMIEKCAEARALRRAFPLDMAGLYSDEEMDQADSSKASDGPAKQPKEKSEDKDPIISEKDWELLSHQLQGYETLKKKLLTHCSVNVLSDIKESQLERSKLYVTKNIAAMENQKKGSADELDPAQPSTRNK